MGDLWTVRKRSDDENYEVKNFNSAAADAQFQRDRARIIHSSSFRRLQSKTQVLTLGESDFYRTRLTHSLEVAQVGSSICEHLKEITISEEIRNLIPPTSLIESICLAHDLGHPPFGHGGEVALNHFMRDDGGFEGNGQTLRIASKLGEYSPNHGLDLTRRTLLGLIKYPVTHSQVRNYQDKKSDSSNIESSKPPKCIHDDEKDILDWIIMPFSENDKNLFTQIQTQTHKHHRSSSKCLDTSIMELADDIAYGVHDLEDALALTFVTQKEWSEHILSNKNLFQSSPIIKDEKFYLDKLFSKSGKERKHGISKLVGYFISGIQLKVVSNTANSNFLKYNAIMDDEAKKCLELLKKLVRDFVIFRPQVQALEFKGQQTIRSLFETFLENPKRLLPENVQEKYKVSGSKNRIICDYIAGMTDVYATKQYRRLFVPDIGSIFDRL
ncbi:anti-phage deoxyguanosine triphosphatase [Undibacterium aquatile]|uniref:Deoxyguanosinetriphosphate triphosphohydrolase-like protein n=1 Tax=Undibacterium aquatile TaxID=1537398 RepID=A0ABR6XC06_9BURK|nr:anti-phage deoxyguanosine triphosphatase [Undibacterium aquatile]MBC3810457.1 deoxyguanosinetriphosphate triphosphohydrolase family protein [Undibacterium aquatile]